MTRYGWWKALIFVALLGLCAAGPVAAQGTTYADPQGRFTFTVPSGWQQGSLPPNTNLPAGTAVGAVFSAAAPLNGNFNIVTVAVPAGVSLDQVVTQSRAGVAQSLPGYQEVAGGIQNLTVGGQPARRYDYLLSPPQAGTLHGAQVITMQANTVYVITFTAAENDFNTFFQQGATALNSLTLKGDTNPPVATALPNTGMPTATRWQDSRTSFVLMVGSALIAAGLLLRRRYSRV
ncbi:MAG: DcrB-related protein [Thermomicrobiales bacterium]